ncbi:MAG: Mo-dependent nitrogenase C-terminal domain-containing protein [Cyanobacteria bacterium P01_A01_bin.114]
MTSAIQESPYTESQVKVWLRGLMTIAWADGEFDETEKALIHNMTDSEFAPGIQFETFEPIEPMTLAKELKPNPVAAENFLRMAVMVAIADGVYSAAEDKALIGFCQALDLDTSVLQALQSTLYNLRQITEEVQPGTSSLDSTENAPAAASPLAPPAKGSDGPDPLKPARDWLDQLAVEDPRLARFVCKMIPSDCPFERDVKLFGKKVVHIPPMCKLNPLYEQLVGLRFRALSYLADDCQEDVSEYI